jgi:glycosyltransferase involved in cell wall biosynthesis
MLRRLVFVTQTIDADHPNLSQTIDIVRTLSSLCDELVVVTDRVRRHDLPPNVTFRAFGAKSRPARSLRYLAALGAELREGRPDALLAHMSPTFLILAALVMRPARVPLALWYTHWRAGPSLRLADMLSDLVLTVDRASYPLPSGKVRAIGHAIDLHAFEPRREEPEGPPLRLLALGKTDPWKGLPLLLDAVERLHARGIEARVEIRGPQLTDVQARHRFELEARVTASAVLRPRVTISDAVPRDRVPELIRAAHAVVCPGGVTLRGEALDKVIFEAAACASPVVASHSSLQRAFARLPVRLVFRSGDAADLAEVLAELAEAPTSDRMAAGRLLRRWVEEEHSVDGWAGRVLAALEEVKRS